MGWGFVMEKTIETRRVDELIPHPQNRALYGNEADEPDEQLVDSLKDGMREGEIQITSENVIISGHRRLSNAPLADIEEVRVWVRHDLPSDPMDPYVLGAMLDANLDRVKTNEQIVREWMLRKKIISHLRRERKPLRMALLYEHEKDDFACIRQKHKTKLCAGAIALSACAITQCYEQLARAAKLLRIADNAIESGDADLVSKGVRLKAAINISFTSAYRIARQEGLLTVAPRSEKEPTRLADASIESQEQLPPDAALAVAEPSLPAGLVDFYQKETRRLDERWVPAMDALASAYDLLRREQDRLRNAYGHPASGKLIHTRRYQQVAAAWAEDGSLNKLAELLDSQEATLDSLLLRLKERGEHVAKIAESLQMFTGCRRDNNVHD